MPTATTFAPSQAIKLMLYSVHLLWATLELCSVSLSGMASTQRQPPKSARGDNSKPGDGDQGDGELLEQSQQSVDMAPQHLSSPMD